MKVSNSIFPLTVYICFLLYSHLNFAQTLKFQKTYGGSNYEDGKAILQMPDSGFVIAGSTYSFGEGDYDGYLIRTDKQGKIRWSKTYGGILPDNFNDLIISSDNEFILGGNSESYNGGVPNSAFYVMKTDTSGNIKWSKTYRNEYLDNINKMLPSTDGGFLCVGANDYTIELARIDSSGNLIYGKSYQMANSSGITFSSCGSLLSSGSYMLSGHYRNINNLYNVFIMKIDDSGIPQWIKTYQPSDGSAYITDMEILGDGSLLCAGRTDVSSAAGLTDVLLMKTDANGNLQWANSYGGSNYDAASGISFACDGGIVITGSSSSFKNNMDDLYILKTDANGNLLWSRIYGGYSYDKGNNIITSNDCGFAVIGSTQSLGSGLGDVYLLKLDEEGFDSFKCNVKTINSLQKALTLTTGNETAGPSAWNNETTVSPSESLASTIQTDSICRQCSTPIADFDYVQNKMSINFLNYSEYGGIYSWSFGNGDTDSLESPVYEYLNTGNYTVTLIASNECGVDTIRKDIHIINTSNCLFNIQPGPYRGKDAIFNSTAAKVNANYGTHPGLYSEYWTWASEPGSTRSTFQFDLLPICDTAALLGANLSLFYPTSSSGYLYSNADNGCTLFRNISVWEENTVTWNTRPAYTTIRSVNVPPVPKFGNLIGLDVLQITKDMVNYGNNGFTIKLNTESTYRGCDFASSDFPVASERPMLQLVFNPLTANVTYADTTICRGDSIQLSASGGIKYKWYPSYGLSCTDCANPKTSPANTVTYSVFVYSCESCAEVKKIKVTIHALSHTTTTKEDVNICSGDTVLLTASAGTSFLWMPGNQKTSAISVIPKNTTAYSVIVSDSLSCSTSLEKTIVNVHPLPVNSPIDNNNITHCFDNGTLTIGAAWGTSFYWEPGKDTTQFISIDHEGSYNLTVFDQFGCSLKEQILIQNECTPRIFVPDAFSPNSDGLHDDLEIFGRYFKNFEMKIFNRWGEIIFITTDRNIRWDGTYRGEAMPIGTYPWIISYQSIFDQDQKENIIRGSVTLIR